MNIMLFHRLWICWVSSGHHNSKLWFPRGTGYIDNKVSCKWILIWRIQLMWLYQRRPIHMPWVCSLKRAVSV